MPKKLAQIQYKGVLYRISKLLNPIISMDTIELSFEMGCGGNFLKSIVVRQTALFYVHSC